MSNVIPLRREAMPSWRGLAQDLYWRKAPGVVVVDKAGRRNTYEVYINGEQIGREYRLDEAKAAVEARIGPCHWSGLTTEQVKADHYWFGTTTEFTDPARYYTATPVLGMAQIASAKPPAVLYHFTSGWHIDSILDNLVLTTTESNIEFSGAGPEVVWLTSNPEPSAQARSGGAFKQEYRIQVDPVGLPIRKWSDWAREQGIEDWWYEALDASGGGRADEWWVCLTAVTRANIRSIDHMA